VTEARKCANCGAVPAQENLRFCGWCGSELPETASASQHVGRPLGDFESRLEALEKHPSVPGILRHEPRSGRNAAAMLGQGVFGLILTGVAGVVFLVFLSVGGPIAILPLFGVAMGLVMTVNGFKLSARYQAAPLERFAAGIVDERIQVKGGGKNSAARTHYFATLQVRGGERREYRVDADIAADVAPGDMGVAFAKANYLLDFSRVDV